MVGIQRASAVGGSSHTSRQSQRPTRRWSRRPGGSNNSHRLIRRGLPYGPTYHPAQPYDGVERGMLFSSSTRTSRTSMVRPATVGGRSGSRRCPTPAHGARPSDRHAGFCGGRLRRGARRRAPGHGSHGALDLRHHQGGRLHVLAERDRPQIHRRARRNDSVHRANTSVRHHTRENPHMAETRITDVLVAGYQDIDQATTDFEALVVLVQVSRSRLTASYSSQTTRTTPSLSGRPATSSVGRAPAGAVASGSPSGLSPAVARLCRRRGSGRRSDGRFVNDQVTQKLHDKVGENLPRGSAGIIAVYEDDQGLAVGRALGHASMRSVIRGDKQGMSA